MDSVIKMGIITVVILIIYCFVTWLLFGKEYDYKKEIISVYEAPKELSSIFVLYILKKNKVLSFELFYIGVLSLIEKGFLTVENTAIFDEKKKSSIFLYLPDFSFSSRNYIFSRVTFINFDIDYRTFYYLYKSIRKIYT